MDFGTMFKRAGKLAAENSPAILTTLGVTGTLTTAYLAAKASFKAAEVISEEEAKLDQSTDPEAKSLEFKDKANIVWKLYVPAAGMCALTIAAIVGVNHIGTRRAAALASAYSISEKAFDEYKKKVVDKVGKTKEAAVRTEVAQDRVNSSPLAKSTLIVTGVGDTQCLDLHSGRYFTSDLQTLKKAVNDFNAQVINENYASLTDFWSLIGLSKTAESDDIGWNTDRLLDPDFDAVIGEKDIPVITIGFRATPAPYFYRASSSY